MLETLTLLLSELMWVSPLYVGSIFNVCYTHYPYIFDPIKKWMLEIILEKECS